MDILGVLHEKIHNYIRCDNWLNINMAVYCLALYSGKTDSGYYIGQNCTG
jgi:hypothetical protein